MKVLITGATGFVGTELVEALLRKGHQLVLTTRDPAKAKKKFVFPCEIYQWDPIREPLPSEAMDGVEIVVNLMGENIGDGRWSESRKERIISSRIQGTRNLVESFKGFQKSKLRKIISTSAVGFYGDTKDNDIDEHSPKGKGFLAELCNDWEACLEQASFINDVKKVILRVGVVLDEGGGALEKMLPPFMLGLGGRLGDGQQYMSWIHRKDLVNLIIFSLELEEVEGVLNATAPHPVSNREFTKILSQVIKRPAIFPVPKLALKILLGEMAEMLLTGQKVFPAQALDLGFRFKYPHLRGCLENALERRLKGEQTLKKVTWVRKGVPEVFNFFSNEKNLEKLTPKFLNFKVLGKSTDELKTGTLIDYRLKIRGIPARWQSKIDQWEPNKSFVDTQILGPYKRWHHLHSFMEYQGGTLVCDRIHYQVPGGLLGRFFLGSFIKRDLENIFSFRQSAIKDVFNG